jgi:tRNA(Ile)-lysidine synthase TilS/MesJ
MIHKIRTSPIFASLVSLIVQCAENYNLPLTMEPVIVGLSGGKDSTFLTIALKEMNCNILPVIVDLGYEGFMAANIKAAVGEYGIHAHILDASELPVGEPKINRALQAIRDSETLVPCTACSLLKREALRLFANRKQIRYILFAHHQDDFVATIMKDYFINLYYLAIGKYSPEEFASFISVTNIDLVLLESMITRREASTMAIRLPLSDDVELLRPMARIREENIRELMTGALIKVHSSGCSHGSFINNPAPPRSKREIVHAEMSKRALVDSNLLDNIMTIALRSLSPTGEALFNPRQTRKQRMPFF